MKTCKAAAVRDVLTTHVFQSCNFREMLTCARADVVTSKDKGKQDPPVPAKKSRQ